MLELDWTLVINAVNLIVLFLLLRKFLIKPIMSVIEARQELIDGNFENAAKTQKDANALKKQWEDSMADIDSHKKAVIDEARTKAKNEYDKIIVKADEDANRIIKDAQDKIASERDRTFKEAENEIAGLAMMAAAKIITENSNDENNKTLYNKFLSKVGDVNESNIK